MWEAWKKIVEKIANFQSSVIFSILYFILVVPLGLVANYFKDFLRVHKGPQWVPHEDFVSTPTKLKGQ